MYQPETEKRDRVNRVVDKEYKIGGMITAKEDHASDAKMVQRGVGKHESALHKGEPKTRLNLRDGGMADGGMSPNRMDQRGRSGGSKGVKPRSQVNVIIAGHPPGAGAPGAAPPPAMPPRPPVIMPPPPAPPMGGPPGMPPGGASMMPPPRPPMAGGPPGMMPPGAPGPGAVPPRPMIKTGGRTPAMSAGSGSGPGRLEKIEREC